ncbi:MAG: TIGR04283 family arsenosugar biosynthesis glycosyltransferase [Desulfobulbales bacterium]
MSTDRKTSNISVIIPTYNEAENIAMLLPELLSAGAVEVIVADGSSTDGTAEKAKALGATVLVDLQRNRAFQMNAGAKAARGELLLFLHGDTRLAPGFVEKIKHTLAQPGVAAGAFSLKIAGKGIGLRIIERLANFRASIFQMPYGDQGIFITAAAFSALDGFPALPIMEDFALVRKLKRRGRIQILSQAATTSVRRWEKLGLLRTTILNQLIILGYLFGIKPEKLATWYRQEK